MYSSTLLSTDTVTTYPLQSEYHWYAVYTRSRFEKKVFHELQRSNFQVFLPMVKAIKVWSDRLKTVHVPLLPGYVFVKLDQQHIPKLSYYPGVVRLVTFGSKPCPVRHEEIQFLEQVIQHGMPVQQSNTCGVGDKVRIVRGPLQGWEGQVETQKSQSRIVFQLTSIMQCISVEVNMGDVERVNS